MDWDQLAAELVRALRGKTSQAQLSRRLGYRSNIVQRWESGRCWPGAEVLWVLYERRGERIDPGLSQFLALPVDEIEKDETNP